MHRNRFLYCLLPIGVTSTFGFQIDEIEKDFLRANSTPEFSHSLGGFQPFPICPVWGAHT
jgi:hypothetical protein